MNTEDISGKDEPLETVLARMAEIYSTCDTYDDVGSVTQFMPDESGGECEYVDFFSTVFDRQNKRFRFEVRSPLCDIKFRGCIAWKEAESAKFWSQLRDKAEIVDNIGIGLAGAVGICGSVAVEVPQLLMPEEVGARGLMYLDGLELAGEAEFNGCQCLRIIGSYPSDCHTTFCLDKKTSLILKIEESQRMAIETSGKSHNVIIGSGPFVARTIINYSPRIDCKIADYKFEFGVST